MAVSKRSSSPHAAWARRSDFDSMLDEELVFIARNGCAGATEYLISKYRALVEGKARSYFLQGADHEDVVQEGLIGLFKAIRDYRSDKLAHFKAFAEICITRQIITAIKRASRHKHDPLNSYISLQNCEIDGDNWSERIADERVVDPVDVVLRKYSPNHIKLKLGTLLTELESRVFDSYLQGKTYREMAADLCRRTKSIDNALQRVKRKIGAELVDLQN